MGAIRRGKLMNEKDEDLDFEIKFYEGILAKQPDFLEALVALGELYTKRGLFERGLEVDRKLSGIKPEDPIIWYNLACSYSLVNRLDESFDALKTSIHLGYNNFDYLNADTDLKNLRNDNRYLHVMALVKKKKES